MVDPKPKRPVGRPRKVALEKPAAAPAEKTPAPAVAKAADKPPEIKPIPATPAPTPTPVVAKAAAAPVSPKPAASTPPPAKTVEKAVEVAARVVEPIKVAPVAEKAAVVEPVVVEKVADVAAAVVEKAAAIPAEIAKPVTPPPAAKPAQKGFFTMAESVSAKSFVPTPESVQALLGDVSTRTKAALEKGAKLAEELGDFAKGNVEALLTSSRVAAKGAETLGQEAAAYSKKSLETATSAFKGFASAKSPTELFKLQSDYARSSFDAAVAESSKFSEAVMKLFGEISQPISTRVALAAEKIKTPAF